MTQGRRAPGGRTIGSAGTERGRNVWEVGQTRAASLPACLPTQGHPAAAVAAAAAAAIAVCPASLPAFLPAFLPTFRSPPRQPFPSLPRRACYYFRSHAAPRRSYQRSHVRPRLHRPSSRRRATLSLPITPMIPKEDRPSP